MGCFQIEWFIVTYNNSSSSTVPVLVDSLYPSVANFASADGIDRSDDDDRVFLSQQAKTRVHNILWETRGIRIRQAELKALNAISVLNLVHPTT